MLWALVMETIVLVPMVAMVLRQRNYIISNLKLPSSPYQAPILENEVHPQIELVAELLNDKKGWLEETRDKISHPSGVRVHIGGGPVPLKYSIKDATGEWKSSVPLSDGQRHDLRKLANKVRNHIENERDRAITMALAERVLAYEQGTLPSLLAGPELDTSGAIEHVGMGFTPTTVYDLKKRRIEVEYSSSGNPRKINVYSGGRIKNKRILNCKPNSEGDYVYTLEDGSQVVTAGPGRHSFTNEQYVALSGGGGGGGSATGNLCVSNHAW